MNLLQSDTHLLYLSRKDIEEVGVELQVILELIEKSFIEKGKGSSIMEPKHWYEGPEGSFYSAMSAYTPAFGVAGVKWQSGVPNNPAKNLPYISGYLILNDIESGLPVAIMDSTWITAVRTGAQTAVSAKYLATRNAEVLAVLGCGVQGRTNLDALLLLLPRLKHVQAFDINSDNLRRYEQYVKDKGIEVAPCKTREECIKGADLIVTAGPIHRNPAHDIAPEWLKDGVLAVPLDYDSYWQAKAIGAFDKFFTDDARQILHYQEEGSYFLNVPEIDAEFSEIITGKKPGRETDSEKIMCMNLGVAIEDTPIASEIYRRAKDRGIGVWLRR